MIQLTDFQIEAIRKMHNGCILRGGTGSGKTLTSLAYVYENVLHGETPIYPEHSYKTPSVDTPLYVITTPKKRDSCDWTAEAANIPMAITAIDSWNNIRKYEHVENAVFIFDETKVIGYGAWTHSFLRIVKKNRWILLSATPADTWLEYMPVFIANGYFKNKTEFERMHVVWSRFAKYPKVERYIGISKLLWMRDQILVDMHFDRKTVQHHIDVLCDFDSIAYRIMWEDRWDVYNQRPFRDISQLCYGVRKLVNSDESRAEQLLPIYNKHKRLIIFYNYNYELDLLRVWCQENKLVYAEWNGHKHEPVPDSEYWVYLCQYTAAQEAWNCIATDCTVFYSQTYSYKALIQSIGRIDRMNTPFIDLYYYHFGSLSGIDRMIQKSLSQKENFNEKRYSGLPEFKSQ